MVDGIITVLVVAKRIGLTGTTKVFLRVIIAKQGMVENRKVGVRTLLVGARGMVKAFGRTKVVLGPIREVSPSDQVRS